MVKQKKLIFFGNERLATAASTNAPIFRGLVEEGYQIEAVIASHEDGVSRQKRDLEIGLAAKEAGVPVILSGHRFELIDKLKKHPADAAVLVAFGQIIPQEVIDFFPLGIINIHPSLLPSFRGSTPIESAILGGLTETGVSLMKLSAKMDAGPVYAQARLPLSGSESKQDLADMLANLGRNLLLEKLPQILSGELKPESQNEDKATYCERIQKIDGIIDWHKPAKQIEREIRAYAGWPGSRTEIFGKEVIVTKAHCVPSMSKESKPGDIEVLSDVGILMIYGKDGYICVDKIKPAGKNEMSAADFIRGYYEC